MSLATDFIAPQLAKEGDFDLLTEFLTNDAYIIEQKLDGNRVMLVSQGDGYGPLALTRGGSPYSKKIPTAVQNFRMPGIPAFDVVFDGELVRNGSDDYTYWVFDLPVLHGERNLTLSQRRAALEAIFAADASAFPFKLAPQAKTTDEKIALVERAMTENLEGLVVKRADSIYHHGGRNTDWLKLKFVTTADCIVLDVRDDGKDSVRLGLVEEAATTGVPGVLRQTVDVGRASLIGKEKNGVINKGDVIEVRYLYTGAGGRLYQPTILRKRTDKRPDECTTEQLKHVNKSVLASL